MSADFIEIYSRLARPLSMPRVCALYEASSPAADNSMRVQFGIEAVALGGKTAFETQGITTHLAAVFEDQSKADTFKKYIQSKDNVQVLEM